MGQPRIGKGPVAGSIGVTATDWRRRDEILETASQVFASSGLRASLQEIADQCGIQPGSLYHHFESKEAIVVELLNRYHADLDRIADSAFAELARGGSGSSSDQIVKLGTAIADCAVRHSAAVQFTFYEPPASAGHELVQVAGNEPTAIESAMLETLRAGRLARLIRPGVDLDMLTVRFCQTMLHVGLGLFHRYNTVHRIAGLLCKILLNGVAAIPPKNVDLDRSSALLAVKQIMQTWQKEELGPAEDPRLPLVRQVARAEFGRRGYEVTTVRDIAAATGLSMGTVYRLIGSKEELLSSIMISFSRKVLSGWNAVLDSDSTTVEKLDALAWLHINVMDQFNEEFKIQLAWLRKSPPDLTIPAWSLPAVLRKLKSLLGEGVRRGELEVDNPSAELTARCLIELSWIPEQIVRESGKRAALIHSRDTVLRGVVRRGRA